MPATPAADACTVVERIRKAIERSVTHSAGTRLHVTASFGLSQVAGEDDAAAVIRRADKALYRSKEAGRNCGHWHNGQECVPIVATQPTEPPGKRAEAREVLDRPQQTSTIRFIQELRRRVTDSHRYGAPLSLMHVGMNDYEAVCSGQDSEMRKRISEIAAAALVESLRDTDLLAPQENGQFIIMLPGSTEAEAFQMAKRMRITLSNYDLPLADGEVPLRLDYGIAQLKPGETASVLMARAQGGLIAPVATEHAVDA